MPTPKDSAAKKLGLLMKRIRRSVKNKLTVREVNATVDEVREKRYRERNGQN